MKECQPAVRSGVGHMTILAPIIQRHSYVYIFLPVSNTEISDIRPTQLPIETQQDSIQAWREISVRRNNLHFNSPFHE